MCASIAEEMKHYIGLGVLLMCRSNYRDCGLEMFLVVACRSKDDVLDAICEYQERCIGINLLIGCCVFENMF
jgi:hypothetical protein